jgi:hypothetical protein
LKNAEIINEINQESPIMSGGTNKKIKLVLDDEIESFFAYPNWSNSG